MSDGQNRGSDSPGSDSYINDEADSQVEGGGSVQGVSDNLGKTTKLSLTDVVQLFYPYVEMTDRFKRVFNSHSYLNYFMQNQNSLFGNDASEACELNPATSTSSATNEKKLFRFFKNSAPRKKLFRKNNMNKTS